MSQRGYIAGKSRQADLIPYANEITISLGSVNPFGLPDCLNKILHDGL